MNKTELIATVAESADLTKNDAQKAVNAFIDTVIKTLSQGGSVTLVGFGTFSTKYAPRGLEGTRKPVKQSIFWNPPYQNLKPERR